MDLSRYTESVREQLASASALADEQTQQVVQNLGTSLDSALRLTLIQALSDAAVAISAELAPTTVEVRMDGAEPEFVVRQAPTSSHDDSYAEESDDEDDERDDDLLSDEEDGQARISLRLSTRLKQRVDDAADEDQVSTNAWINEAVVGQLRRRRRRDFRGYGSHRRGRHGNWNDVFGPEGPFGPHGPFGPNGPFGPGRPFPPDPPRAGGAGGQRYKGWV